MKNLGEKGAWAQPGTTRIFWVPPIISGTRKDTNFKFGTYIRRVHPNKCPLKFGRKWSVGVSRDCTNFLSPTACVHNFGNFSLRYSEDGGNRGMFVNTNYESVLLLVLIFLLLLKLRFWAFKNGRRSAVWAGVSRWNGNVGRIRKR